MVGVQLGDASSSPPPKDRANEMPAEGERDSHVDARPQTGGGSAPAFPGRVATASREEIRGTHSGVDIQPGFSTIQASRSNPEPTQVYGENPSMGNACWNAGPTVRTQPQEPTSTNSLVRSFVSGAMIGSDVSRPADARWNSNDQTKWRAQPQELLPPLSGAVRTPVVEGKGHHECIGGADWLDVTHAMLDTDPNGLGLDYE